MKNTVFKPSYIYLLITVVIFGLGCGMFSQTKNTVDGKYLDRQKNAAKIEKQINETVKEVENKGSALVYAASYVLHQETNKIPSVIVSSRFLDLAELTLSKPSVKDVTIVEEIAEGLLDHYRGEYLRLQLENSKLETNSSLSRETIKKLEKEIQILDKKANTAETDLKKYEKNIISLEEKEIALKKDYEAAISKLQRVNEENSGKAALYDEEHGFWQQFNIFKDIISFIKKLFVIGLLGSVIFLAFKILEVFFPALNILSTLCSFVVGIFKRIVPAAFSAAGMVSSKMMKTLEHVVAAQNNIFKRLRDLPLEDELIEHYPSDYKFTKEEVKKMLYKLTDNTLESMESELKAATNEETRGVISRIKDEQKGNKPLISLI